MKYWPSVCFLLNTVADVCFLIGLVLILSHLPAVLAAVE